MLPNYQHKFNKEIAELISTSAMASPQGILSFEVVSHLSYLARFVESTHSVGLHAEEPVPIDHTYNPPKFGRAFYFQNNGKQVKKMRKFTIDNQKKIATTTMIRQRKHVTKYFLKSVRLE